MLLTKFKPTSNGIRWKYSYNMFFKQNKFRNFISLKHKSGRNNTGIITVRHRKKHPFSYVKFNNLNYYSVINVVYSIFQLKKKSIFIMELVDNNKNFFYTRCVSGVNIGYYIYNNSFSQTFNLLENLGSNINITRLSFNAICCIVRTLHQTRFIATSPGTYCLVAGIDTILGFVKLILPSGKYKIVSRNNICTIGRNAGEKNNMMVYGKAGEMYYQGFRPTVRGVAMNPVDHPHGGRTKTVSPEKSPWGWVTKYNK